MTDRPTRRGALRTALSYVIGFAITAVIFWLFGKSRHYPGPQPNLVPDPVSTEGGGLEEPSPPGFEHRDASAKAVTLVGLGFLVALALVIVVTTLLFFALTGTSLQLQVPPPGQAISASPPTPLPPSPRLETEPGQTLSAIRAQEDVLLYSYAWVDRAHGIVRIPIDRAMALVAEQGLPTRPGDQQGYQDTGMTVPSGSSSGRALEELQH